MWFFRDKRIWLECVFGAVASIRIFLIVVWFLRRRRNRYIGFGWVLWRNEALGPRVRIISRLLESPSGRAGVDIGDFLVAYKGQWIKPGFEDRFIEWIRHNRPKLGEKVDCVLVRSSGDEEYSVTLSAEYIQGPIPVYGKIINPNRSDPTYACGMAVCAKTGQPISTYRLSDACIEKVLSP